jgi:hypothetical protein
MILCTSGLPGLFMFSCPVFVCDFFLVCLFYRMGSSLVFVLCSQSQCSHCQHMTNTSELPIRYNRHTKNKSQTKTGRVNIKRQRSPEVQRIVPHLHPHAALNASHLYRQIQKIQNDDRSFQFEVTIIHNKANYT